MAEYKCGDCFHADLCEKSGMLLGFSRDNPAYCSVFLNSADVAPVQKWIPATERLPEEEGLYLVAVVNDHERRYSKTAWYHGHGNWFLHQKVTHWMPLPEPPKEE